MLTTLPTDLLDEALAELEAWSRAYPGVNDTSALIARVKAARDTGTPTAPLSQTLADYDYGIAAYEDGKGARDADDEIDAYSDHEDRLVEQAHAFAHQARSLIPAAAALSTQLAIAHTTLHARLGSDADAILRDVHRAADAITTNL